MSNESAQIQNAVRARSRVGEAPVWHEGLLHWVDILAGQINVSDLADGSTTTVTVPTLVGAAVPMAGGYVVATREGYAQVLEGALVEVDPFLPAGIRMNDGKCDPLGRFWAGSCAENFARGAGSLHRLNADWSRTAVLEGLTQPNGLGWSPDASTFYLVDTQDLAAYAYPYDSDTGALGERRVLARFDVDRDGYPDGLAVDAEGCLWIAMWAGSMLIRISPQGELVSRLAMPVPQPTSCAFVGADLANLCVTSAAEGVPVSAADLDGSVFVVTHLEVRGAPVETFAGSA